MIVLNIKCGHQSGGWPLFGVLETFYHKWYVFWDGLTFSTILTGDRCMDQSDNWQWELYLSFRFLLVKDHVCPAGWIWPGEQGPRGQGDDWMILRVRAIKHHDLEASTSIRRRHSCTNTTLMSQDAPPALLSDTLYWCCNPHPHAGNTLFFGLLLGN